MCDQQSAQWSYNLGADHRTRFPYADAAERSKLCPFDPASDHARWYRLGYAGGTFLWAAK